MNGESPIVDGGDDVLWRNAEPARLLEQNVIGRLIAQFFMRYRSWIAILVGGWLLWDNYTALKLDAFSIVTFFIGAIIAAVISGWLTIPFLYKHPSQSAIPNQLTADTLLVAHSKVDAIPVKTIRAVSPTFHEGSPALLIALPKRSLALVTSERDALMRALLTLRPDLETTS